MGCSTKCLLCFLTQQRVHFHHPVQHPLIHEREKLALDEAVLQDKASVTKCGGREGDADHERGVLTAQGGVCKVGGPEEGAGGENGHARPGEK